jgi:hypothetical protein
MKSTAIWSAIAFTLAFATTAYAEIYSDPDANFKVSVPEGWKGAKVPDQFVKYMMATGSDKDHAGICMVVTQKHPELAQQSQAEIDAQMGPLVDEKFWQFAFTMAPGIDEAQVLSATTEVRGGRNVYAAVLQMKKTDKASGQTADATGKEIMIVIPGQFYFVTCLTATAAWPNMKDQFDTVLNSFEPLTDVTVAQADVPGVSSLTLYTGEKYAGVSRVVTQDTPDLTVYGWHKPAGSVSISGAAPWEVCSGANYAGNCRVVSGAFASSLSKSGAILSARHARGPAVMLRSLQSDVARALGETAQRAH